MPHCDRTCQAILLFYKMMNKAEITFFIAFLPIYFLSLAESSSSSNSLFLPLNRCICDSRSDSIFSRRYIRRGSLSAKALFGFAVKRQDTGACQLFDAHGFQQPDEGIYLFLPAGDFDNEVRCTRVNNFASEGLDDS